MSAEVSIAFGVAGRVLANVVCAHNPRLGAAIVGVFDGFLIHRSWISNTLFDPLNIIIIGASIAFDYHQFPELEDIFTLLLGCGLGIVLSDVGPDLLQDLGGGHLVKDVRRDFDYFVNGYDSSSEVGSESGSVVSRTSSRRTSRSGTTNATGTSATARPGPSSTTTATTARPRPRSSLGRAPSTSTRLSRVTFDEASISQSAASTTEDLDGDGSSAAPSSATERPTRMEDLYMEPSTTSAASALGMGAAAALGAGSSHTRVSSRPPSILRRLDIPGAPAPPVASIPGPSTSSMSQRPVSSSLSTDTSSITSGRSRLTSDGESTPTVRPTGSGSAAEFYGERIQEVDPEPEPEPLSADSAVPFLPPPPNTQISSQQAYSQGYGSSYGYGAGTGIPPPGYPHAAVPSTVNIDYAPSPYSDDTVPVPLAFPEPAHTVDTEGRSTLQSPTPDPNTSRLSRILNVPMSDPHTYEEEAPPESAVPTSMETESPQSALWVPPVNGMRSRSRSRSRSPMGPREPREAAQMQMQMPTPPPPPEPEPHVEAFEDVGPAPYISESYEDATVDTRQLDRPTAIAQIEEAWKIVEKRRHKRLNILVRHDDDELQSGPNSTFRLLEDLENLRFNAKVRPGLIIITSRSRG